MEKVISVEECMEMCGYDVEFMKEIIALTREDMIECSHIVSNTYTCNDMIGLKNVAHRIKGEASMIAAKSLTESAKNVEYSSNEGFITKLEYLCLILNIKEFIKHTRNI